MSLRSIAVIAAVSLAMAWLGVQAGEWYTDWKDAKDHQAKLEALPRGEATGLRVGMSLPSVELLGLDGNVVDSAALCDGKQSLVLFISIGCDACSQAIERWNTTFVDVLEQVNIFGVADDKLGYVRVYTEETQFRFPMFADETDVFGVEYDVDVYPTIVGVDRDGTITFVRHGVNENFDPQDVLSTFRET